MSDRCRFVIVTLAVPCAVALVWSVRPSSRQPGTLFLDIHDLEAAAGAQLDPWGVPYVFEDGGYTEVVPAVPRAEVTIESDRVLPGGVAPAGETALVSRATRDTASPYVRSSRAVHPELHR